MTTHPDIRYGEATATPIAWDDVRTLFAAAELYWLTTVRADGRPHVTPLVGVWHDDAFAFCTGVGEQKHVNLEHATAVAVTTGVATWADGVDVVLEGHAERVTGRERLAPLAAAWVEKYGEDWAWAAEEETFGDGDGSHPWVYVVRAVKVLAFGKNPHSQTTYRPER